MPDDCKKGRDRLVMEYNRLLAWGKAAGLVKDEEKTNVSISLGADPLEMFNTITTIKSLLEEFKNINSRFKELKPFETPEEEQAAIDNAAQYDVVTDVSSLAISYEKTKVGRKHMLGTNHVRKLFKKSVEGAKNAGVIIAHPSRATWVAVYKDVFEGLLIELHRLTNRLLELMDNYRIRKIQSYTAQTCLEMVQLRNEVAELKDLSAAVKIWVTNAPSALTDANPRYLNMKALVELKFRTLPVDKILLGGSSGGDNLIARYFKKGEITDHMYDSNGELMMPRTRATITVGAKPVWIEWKAYELEEKKIPSETEKRTKALAELLTIKKPDDFCTPTCLGYFDGRDFRLGEKYGWVFEMPAQSPDGDVPRSLLEILDSWPEKTKPPALSARIALASKLVTCLLYLHTVNWLHKGIRSDNVLFIQTGNGIDFTKPKLSGFEYSRPADSGTTHRKQELKWDIYRWPEIQRDVPRMEKDKPKEANSRKTYDVYSLGLVLLEIAQWKPLHKILSLKDWPEENKLEDSQAIRQNLLEKEPKHLEEARSALGEKYYSAMRRCIEAHGENGLGVSAKDDETKPEVALKLQGEYMTKVVEQLRAIDV
jgi:serine/threonine protein kinase